MLVHHCALQLYYREPDQLVCMAQLHLLLAIYSIRCIQVLCPFKGSSDAHGWAGIPAGLSLSHSEEMSGAHPGQTLTQQTTLGFVSEHQILI